MAVDVAGAASLHEFVHLAISEPSWKHAIAYRRIEETDMGALKYLHAAMFPIDYAQDFFDRAARGDGILGYAAVLPQGAAPARFPDPTTVFVGAEQIVGFITARVLRVGEIPAPDRALLGMADPRHDGAALMYILTLGVADAFRKHGVAAALLERVEVAAARAACTGLYLHTIEYNEAASRFYDKSGYACLASLKDFYIINTGRGPRPDVRNYGAFLFKKELVAGGEGGGAVPPSGLSPASLWGQLSSAFSAFGGGKKKQRGAAPPQRGAAPAWLRGLFGSSASAAARGQGGLTAAAEITTAGTWL